LYLERNRLCDRFGRWVHEYFRDGLANKMGCRPYIERLLLQQHRCLATCRYLRPDEPLDSGCFPFYWYCLWPLVEQLLYNQCQLPAHPKCDLRLYPTESVDRKGSYFQAALVFPGF